MRKQMPWSEQKKDLEKQGYKYDENGECIFDPTNPVVEKPKEEEPKKDVPKKRGRKLGFKLKK